MKRLQFDRNPDWIKGRSQILDNGCWMWIGASTSDGYGVFMIKGKFYYAHREMYRQVKGDIPPKMLICHTCDRPGCVNPDHLFLGSYQDNRRDSDQKGRSSRQRGLIGQDCPHSKLTDDDIRKIRQLRAEGWKLKELSQTFHVDQSHVSRIARRMEWTHLD
jgi:hypothetical protein